MANWEVPGLATKPFNEWVNFFQGGSDDWRSGTLEWVMPKPFDNAVFQYGCVVCKRGPICGVKLNHCSGCHMIHYCSSKCQKLHWKAHKLVCPLIKSYMVECMESDSLPRDAESYRAYILKLCGPMRVTYNTLSDSVRQKLSPALQTHEEWMSQQHCISCFRIPAVYGLHGKVDKSEKVNLTHCQVCFSSAHCPNPTCIERFKKLHTRRACEQYLLYMSTKVVSMQFGNTIITCSQSRLESLAPPTKDVRGSLKTSVSVTLLDGSRHVTGHEGEKTVRLGSADARSVAVMPDNWAEYMRFKQHDFAPDVDARFLAVPFALAVLSDSLSNPLSILHTLFLVHGSTALSAMRRIEIHVVETDTSVQVDQMVKYEELLHWLPNCRELVVVHIYSVNVESSSELAHRKFYHRPSFHCSGCRGTGASVKILCLGGRYNGLVGRDLTLSNEENGDSMLFTLQPESAALIACFHSGLHDQYQQEFNNNLCKHDVWMDDLRLFARHPTPVLFTAWDESEVLKDVVVARQVAVEMRDQDVDWQVVVEPFMLPFRGLLPFPDNTVDNAFYYSNRCGFIMSRRGAL